MHSGGYDSIFVGKQNSTLMNEPTTSTALAVTNPEPSQNPAWLPRSLGPSLSVPPLTPNPQPVSFFFLGSLHPPESLGSSGQVLVAQYLGLARDCRKASGLETKAPWDGEALELRETARSIAKRVLTLSLGLGLGLMACSRAIFPLLLAVVCQSKEVAALVSAVRACRVFFAVWFRRRERERERDGLRAG